MSAEMREPLGPSVAYTMGVGVGRGRPFNDASSVASASSSIPMYAGRGAMMHTREPKANRLAADMANAQRPYEQYLVMVCFL